MTVVTPEEISSLRSLIFLSSESSSVPAADKVVVDLVVVVVVILVTILVDEVFVFDAPESGEDSEDITDEKLFISLSLLNCGLSSSKQYLISVSV